MGKQMDEVVGDIDVDLDGQFASIRTSETNLGKLLFQLQDILCSRKHELYITKSCYP